jgi:UDP-N-acetylmuramoyl-L-alanyl-D-glutamate--2,6-diaminopimelate ligase
MRVVSRRDRSIQPLCAGDSMSTTPGPPPMPRGSYLVVGLGRAGSAAADALIAMPDAERVLAWDGSNAGPARQVARRLRRHGVEVWLGGDGIAALEAAGSAAIVIKSPGIYFDIPILERARSLGLQVLDELELGWRLSERPIVGVTGTNGKSTTAKLIAAALEAAGHRPQLAGNTEFGPPLSAATAGDWIVCEASSFQLEAAPSFLPDVAVFTNLTFEHLARHASMERYAAVKRGMFVRAGHSVRTAIVNVDDRFGRRLAADVAKSGGEVLSYGFDAGADVHVERAEWDMREARVSLRTPDGRVECTTKLPGRYNASNLAAAFAMGHALGLPAEGLASRLEGIDGPPGRWEVITELESFDVIVDFAHNPDGIGQLLDTARAVADSRGGALRAVYGATGRGDPAKARRVGGLARALSDHLILTTGTIPNETRITRLGELRQAATKGGVLELVLDRREAIERAVAVAQPGDVVAVLGLGALAYQVLDVAGTTCPFDDRQVVREALHQTRAMAWS